MEKESVYLEVMIYILQVEMDRIKEKKSIIIIRNSRG